MSTLETVADYIGDARTLLQDTIAPNRYDDPSLLVALNVTLMEIRRIRPDLFVFEHHERTPNFTAVNTQPIELEPPFRLALVYGTVAHALARDQEDVQDARSAGFMRVFYSMLLGMAVPGVQSPQPGAKP
jgi:hypothetical protein